MTSVLPESFLAIGDIHGDLESLRRALEIGALEDLAPVFFGDIVGGNSDSACIEILRRESCLVLRGNHDQWAVERRDTGFSQEDLNWLNGLGFSSQNHQTLALHTDYEAVAGVDRILWHELQSKLEVSRFLEKHPEKRFVLAAHTHNASITYQAGDQHQFSSQTRLRKDPTLELKPGGQYFIDIGWARDNVVVFRGTPHSPSVRYIFFG